MKHCIRYIQNIYIPLVSFGSLMLLVMTQSLSSCATDDSVGPFQNGFSDSTIVSLNFFISDEARTRAINSGNENLVSDVTVLVFDNTNSLIGSKYVTSALVASIDVPVTTRSATGCTIYAIANTGSASYFAGVNTIDQLNAKYTTISSPSTLESNGSTANSTGALMVGKASATITKGGANQFPITLYHQCGKITFTMTPASGVTITGYQLCNVPLSSYITDSHVPTSASVVVGPPAGAGSYGNFAAESGLNQTVALSKTYYVYENLCGSNSGATTEALRNSSKAPTTASYLLINAKGRNWVSTYKVYLGGVTNTATPATDLTNFNVYRNLNYQCNISLGANGGNGDARVTYTISPAVVGQYLFADGTWGDSGSNTSSKIGYIFKTTGSTTYPHGYAVALTDASTGCTSTNVSSAVANYKYSVPYSNVIGSSGWYLPSKDDLLLIGQTMRSLVSTYNMITYWYWSSTWDSADNALFVVRYAYDGSTTVSYNETNNFYVRTIIQF